jgi:hypothetical protein
MITKTDAAERQLNTAIRLFFENRDHLSSYALAVASREVTDGVSKKGRDELYQRELARIGDPQKVRLSYWEMAWDIVKPEYKHSKDLKRLHNKRQNFLKHADEDPDAEIEPIKAKQLALAILTAIWNYHLLTQRSTDEMKIFFAWIAVAEPQLLKSAPEDVTFNKAVDQMRSFISGDPYDCNTLENIYAAITKAAHGGRRFICIPWSRVPHP